MVQAPSQSAPLAPTTPGDVVDAPGGRAVSQGLARHPEPEARSLALQHTIGREVRVVGKGLLHGKDATVVIKPAPANHGVVFVRVDRTPPAVIPAHVRNVVERARRTTLRSGSATIDTVEHCMSALAGMRIDNALIEIDGPEMPCGDGSAGPYIDALIEAGVVEQNAPRRVFRVDKPIIVEQGDARLVALPTRTPEFQVIFDLDYGPNSHRIQRQTQSFVASNGDYQHEIARARTFSLAEEAKALWDSGYCKHLTPRDVLVIGDNGPIENAYRFDNEPVRHKVLDLIGDLYMVGGEIHAQFVAHASGHALNRRMCLKIIEQDETQRRGKAALEGCELSIRTIQRIMPHRYPMLLVDRVVSIEGDRKAVGVKNVSINEPFFQGHYPGTPIMPGVLIVEAMAQLGGLLMSQKLEHTGKIAVLLSLDKVKLRKPVTPGDQLILEAEAIRATSRTGALSCKAYVGDKLAAEAQIRFMMVDAEQE